MEIENKQAIGSICFLSGRRAREASAMFLLPQVGFTCTKSVAEYLIIFCSRKVFGCGGGSWFKPKVNIFLLNWNKHINVTSAASLGNKGGKSLSCQACLLGRSVEDTGESSTECPRGRSWFLTLLLYARPPTQPRCVTNTCPSRD